ncbi:hypothetical protein vBEcoMWL3_gp097 [Escherichia phage vB_EcoM_WL-3]|nr:hypothetical protein vBEcoMWL3_gp097 [Escherichia phage vB_EcoM_WL-3]
MYLLDLSLSPSLYAYINFCANSAWHALFFPQ